MADESPEQTLQTAADADPKVRALGAEVTELRERLSEQMAALESTGEPRQ